jgi:RNA polymerase sigma factor (sigma-70 family)
MGTAQLAAVVRHIRDLAADHETGEQTDGALLRAFLSRNNQPAFEALLRRHGPMVWRVCQRTLGNTHDAEDALQATFLVLAQRATSIRKAESLASWLHGVAYRMAANARKAAARRHKHESQVNPTPPRDPALSAAWQELQVLLDEQIQGLPETLRATFVLCCLENKSCAEAAQQLGLEEGAVWKRLSRARKLLRERLSRRGVSLVAALAAVAVGAKDASAALSRSLVVSMAKAAAQMVARQPLACGLVSAKVMTLIEGVDQAMFLSKCKMAILVISCSALLGAGLGLASLHRASAESPKEPPPQKATGGISANAEEVVQVRGRVLDPEGKPVLLAMSGTATSRTAVAEPQLKLQVLGPAKTRTVGEEIKLEVVLSTDGDQSYEFLLGAFPQAFGVYVLGPWGAIQPDMTKVRPENWMHQEHSTAARIIVAKGKPYRTTVKLSDYFPVTDAAQFKPGAYQVNVKFYETRLKMSAPIDSGAMRFELAPKK